MVGSNCIVDSLPHNGWYLKMQKGWRSFRYFWAGWLHLYYAEENLAKAGMGLQRHNGELEGLTIGCWTHVLGSVWKMYGFLQSAIEDFIIKQLSKTDYEPRMAEHWTPALGCWKHANIVESGYILFEDTGRIPDHCVIGKPTLQLLGMKGIGLINPSSQQVHNELGRVRSREGLVILEQLCVVQ